MCVCVSQFSHARIKTSRQLFNKIIDSFSLSLLHLTFLSCFLSFRLCFGVHTIYQALFGMLTRSTRSYPYSESESRSAVSDSLQPHGIYSPWISLGHNTGVVAIPFSRGSSQPRDQTHVSHIASRFFTS